MGAFVYILASKPRGTLYVGVTNDLVRRVWEHRDGQVPGFTKRHGVKMLVYYEAHATVRWRYSERKISNAGFALGRLHLLRK